MFISTFENKLDKKGRVSVPASYRININNEGDSSIVCYPSFTLPAIEFCPKKRLDKIIEAIDTLNPFEEKRDIFSTSILANSYQLNFDSEGRVLLHEKLLSHASIINSVLFVGQGKTFQMWSPDKFKKFSLSAQKKANLKRAELKWKGEN